MIVHLFEQDHFSATGRLFPTAIEDDPWMLFHGTSGSNEAEIESHGLAWTPTTYSREEVAGVCSVFGELNWAGFSHGGYAVLKPFSLDHDFAHGSMKPIYLAETSFRAVTFASQDFAGGETARALRYAMNDLTRLLSFATLQTQPTDAERRSLSDLKSFSVDWLRIKINDLTEVQRRAGLKYDKHTHGVVYCVRCDESLVSQLCWHRPMGVKALGTISTRQLAAKVVIPTNCKKPLTFDAADFLNRVSGGVFARMAQCPDAA